MEVFWAFKSESILPDVRGGEERRNVSIWSSNHNFWVLKKATKIADRASPKREVQLALQFTITNSHSWTTLRINDYRLNYAKRG
jgi:hypothetical protein